MTAEPFWTRHRGPYLLCITRPLPTKQGSFGQQWLSALEAGPEAESQALAFLADPRDTITGVDIWSDREECFVMSYKRGDA